MASLQSRLADLITAVGTDVKALQARKQVIVLGPVEAVPGGTPAGTVIVRTTT